MTAGRTTLLPVLLGSAVLLGAGFVTTVALPTADAVTTTETDATRGYTVGEARGREIYVNQGCVYCHTQQVRDTYTDAGLGGRPTRPGDTLADRPASLGEVRFGPDLRCVGDRVPGASSDVEGDDEAGREELVEAMVDYLRNPDAVHEDSGMPSYRHLSRNDLRRLAAYLVGLQCDSGEEESP
ncbi:MAG TPA: cbb3-type cytochrome c oxidase subunit II [Mycobacteriales bacterium]|nr:cbb3-type cytochrome c oxidase subunit II [Mycobacteriales bacterium]